MNREKFEEILEGYRSTQVLLTANRLALFDELEEGPLSAEELADRLESSRRGVRALADALVALGFLIREGDRYANTTFASESLRKESPRSQTAKLLHGARLYEKWARLYDSVKSGEPVDDAQIDSRLSSDRTRFAQAMAQSARESAEAVAEKLDLAGFKRMLDIGGGPATFAIAFARMFPSIEVVVMDDEETLRVASRNIRKAQLEDRVHVLAGDAFRDPFAGPYDFVFISNLIHIYDSEKNAQLCRLAADSLVPSGLLCLKDFFLHEGAQGPLWTRLFALNMLVSTEGGKCYTFEEAEAWLAAAGLEMRDRIPVTEKTHLVLGEKPS